MTLYITKYTFFAVVQNLYLECVSILATNDRRSVAKLYKCKFKMIPGLFTRTPTLGGFWSRLGSSCEIVFRGPPPTPTRPPSTARLSHRTTALRAPPFAPAIVSLMQTLVARRLVPNAVGRGSAGSLSSGAGPRQGMLAAGTGRTPDPHSATRSPRVVATAFDVLQAQRPSAQRACGRDAHDSRAQLLRKSCF